MQIHLHNCCRTNIIGNKPLWIAFGRGNKYKTNTVSLCIKIELSCSSLCDEFALTPVCCDVHQVVLQCYSEMVEVALSQRLGRSLQQRPAQKGEELEDERAGTPTDMTDVDFWTNFDLRISPTDIKPRQPPTCLFKWNVWKKDYLIYFLVFICDWFDFLLCHIIWLCWLYCHHRPYCCCYHAYLYLLFMCVEISMLIYFHFAKTLCFKWMKCITDLFLMQ